MKKNKIKPSFFRRFRQRIQLSSYRLKTSKKFQISCLGLVVSLPLKFYPKDKFFKIFSKSQLENFEILSGYSNLIVFFFLFLTIQEVIKSSSSNIVNSSK